MKNLIQQSKALFLVVVLTTLCATLAALVWSVVETVNVIIGLVNNYKGVAAAIGSFVQLMDIYLLVAALYIFTVAIYELFIGKLDLPEWLIIHNFDQLKALLANLIVLIAAVTFLKIFLERGDPVATLLYGVALALVGHTLIRYRQHGQSD